MGLISKEVDEQYHEDQIDLSMNDTMVMLRYIDDYKTTAKVLLILSMGIGCDNPTDPYSQFDFSEKHHRF